MGSGPPGPTNALLAQSYVGGMEISFWLASIHSTSVRVCLLLCLKSYLPELRTASSLVRKDMGGITQGNGNIQEKESKEEHSDSLISLMPEPFFSGLLSVQ